MKKYHFISRNPNISEYVGSMARWIQDNSDYSYDQVLELFTLRREQIENLFEPYPETIFHDDPAKWAELLATNWGIIQEKELEFA
ncbi:hypothetical protein [Cytobacillus firmus]|uniref:Uncharacterized protein n=1 Tax=Cytobacillus firmus DS1 TaxID=1307436 RepID=W7KQI4_CYTFI|nr:hypothetical protein [Cytobacillus firmus]EWG08408.1 hypothetical protein PBF_24438 [Cytobacillus firmus DS1]